MAFVYLILFLINSFFILLLFSILNKTPALKSKSVYIIYILAKLILILGNRIKDKEEKTYLLMLYLTFKFYIAYI